MYLSLPLPLFLQGCLSLHLFLVLEEKQERHSMLMRMEVGMDGDVVNVPRPSVNPW